MLIKNVPFELKSGADTGSFEALVAVFGNVDKTGDRILPGAFNASLESWRKSGDPIPVIFNHAWADAHAHIGVVEQAMETPKGLLVKGRLDVADNAVARQVHKLMKRRTLKEFSFGYDVPPGGENRARDGANELSQISLIEVGPTLKGMNDSTQLMAVKSAMQELVEGKADVPNYQAVSPEARARLRGLMAHYAKEAHPFTACVTDNRKRFGDRAERVCAVLKDLIENTTHWRHGKAFDSAAHPRAGAGSATGGQFITAGSGGDAAAAAKQKLGGELTAKRIREYQAKHGLQVDGVIGAQTAAALLGTKNPEKVKPGPMTAKQHHELAALVAHHPELTHTPTHKPTAHTTPGAAGTVASGGGHLTGGTLAPPKGMPDPQAFDDVIDQMLDRMLVELAGEPDAAALITYLEELRAVEPAKSSGDALSKEADRVSREVEAALLPEVPEPEPEPEPEPVAIPEPAPDPERLRLRAEGLRRELEVERIAGADLVDVEALERELAIVSDQLADAREALARAPVAPDPDRLRRDAERVARDLADEQIAQVPVVDVEPVERELEEVRAELAEARERLARAPVARDPDELRREAQRVARELESERIDIPPIDVEPIERELDDVRAELADAQDRLAQAPTPPDPDKLRADTERAAREIEAQRLADVPAAEMLALREEVASLNELLAQQERSAIDTDTLRQLADATTRDIERQAIPDDLPAPTAVPHLAQELQEIKSLLARTQADLEDLRQKSADVADGLQARSADSLRRQAESVALEVAAGDLPHPPKTAAPPRRPEPAVPLGELKQRMRDEMLGVLSGGITE